MTAQPRYDALAALIESGYVGREDGANLIECYEFLRSLEHRLQLQKVKRTHTLPAESDYQTLRWLAHAAGFRGHMTQSSVEKMLDELRKVRLSISSLHHKLFYRPLLDSVVNLSVDTIKLSATAAKEQLRALGYLYPDRAFEHLTALAAGANRKAKILPAPILPASKPKPQLTRKQILENEVRNEQVALVRAQAQLNVAKKKGDQAKISRLTQAVNDRQANIRAIESEMKR